VNTKTFYFNEIRVRTYIVWDDTQECLIIDPGCGSENEQQRLMRFIADSKLKPVLTVNTHAHFDHVMGNAFVARTYGVPGALHKADLPLLEITVQQSALFGCIVEQPPMPAVWLSEEQPVRFGNAQLQVLCTPGHSPGGVCLYSAADKLLFSGDTLFAGGIGRTDLAGGNYDTLLNSITTKLMSLPDDVEVLPGHGPSTTIGNERGAFSNG